MANRIKEMREALKITQTQLAEKIERSRVTVMRWENGDRLPDTDEIKSLALALNTSISYLTGETDDPNYVPVTGIEISPMNVVFTMGANISAETKAQTLQRYETIEIPIYEVSACCGAGVDNEQAEPEILKHIYIDKSILGINHPKKAFGIYATGKSMEPKIYEGDRIVINPNIELDKSGREVCLACYLKGGYMRDVVRYYSCKPDGTVVLKASSLSGEPDMEFSPQQCIDREIVIVGRVMYVDRGEAL